MSPNSLHPRRRGRARVCLAAVCLATASIALAQSDSAAGAEVQVPGGSVDDAASGRIAPKPTKMVSPEHPPEFWKKRVTGSADIECRVDENGKVTEAKVVAASHPEFGAAGLAAVKQWEFEPGKLNGQIAPMRVRVPLNFAIGNEDSLESFLGRKLFQDVPGEVVKAESLTRWPMPKQLVEPKYPPSLRGSGKKGKAVVSIVITPEGKVINPKLVKATYPEFTFPALAAAASMEFPPQSRSSKEKERVYVGMDVQFDFQAEGGKPKAKAGEKPKATPKPEKKTEKS